MGTLWNGTDNALNLSFKPEVIMPVATESFKDSQAAACRDLSIFHPSSPEEEQKICFEDVV